MGSEKLFWDAASATTHRTCGGKEGGRVVVIGEVRAFGRQGAP